MNIEALQQRLAYNPESGVFTWRIAPPRRGVVAGSSAGCRRADGYVGIVVQQRRFYAHRLAWEFTHGAIPAGMEIDHIDHDASNNRIENLRLVTKAENRRNRSADSRNKSGVNGVHWSAGAKAWSAQIRFNRLTRHIGYFKSLDEARMARKAAERDLSFHPNHGATA